MGAQPERAGVQGPKIKFDHGVLEHSHEEESQTIKDGGRVRTP